MKCIVPVMILLFLIGGLVGSYITYEYLDRMYEKQIVEYENRIDDQKRIIEIGDKLIKGREDLVQTYKVLMGETFNTLIELRDHGVSGLNDIVIRIGNVVYGPEEVS